MHPVLRKILLVEDDPDIQTVATTALELVGRYSVAACSSGREALEKGPSYNPDLVLLDVMMPDMDGPTTLEALRRDPTLQNRLIVFMTARTQERDLAAYQRMGVANVIRKPFDPLTLPAEVDGIWRRCHGSV